MTTPANNGPHGGANKPEDDDPFGYLYADGQAAGATPPSSGGGYGYPGSTAGGQPGVPRTSYNQVRTVGERTYGGQRGQVPAQPGPPPYQTQYQSPEALQAAGHGGPPQHQAPPPGSRGGGGSSRKGLIVAAVAVVAAVGVGIGVALTAGGDKGKDKAETPPAATGPEQPTTSQKPADPPPSGSPEPSQSPLPKADASGSGMALTGGAVLMNAVPGAKSAGGQYVGNFNQPGAAVTWTLTVPKGGAYNLRMIYGVPGKDASMTLTVNGTAQTRPVNMRNFAKAAEGDWSKGWTNTYAFVDLKEGTNTVKISCEQGNSCDAYIDQFLLEKR